MKKIFNRYTVIFLALTVYLILYRTMWRVGFPDFYASVIGCAFVYLVIRMTRSELATENTGKKMELLPFLVFLGLTFLGQELMQLVNFLLEALLNGFGKTMYETEEVVQQRELFDGTFAKLTTLFWPVVLGPIVEELLYRSYAAKNFEREGGKVLAILLAAIVFSAGHGRFYLMTNTFISGLVLGYVFFEYGLKWACIFHVINNLGIVGIDLLLCVIFGQTTGTLIMDIVGILFAIFGVGAVILKCRETAAYIRDNRAPAGEYKKAFLNIGFFAMLAYNLYKCVVHIVPM